MDNKIEEIVKRRNFQSFWECVDYLIHASYEEVDALMIALDLFNGEIWKNVITVAKYKPTENSAGHVMAFASGATYSFSASPTIGRILDEGNISAHIYIISNEGDLKYKELYKSYIETKEYQEIKKLENQFKRVSINLNSELAIRLFNDGYSKYK